MKKTLLAFGLIAAAIHGRAAHAAGFVDGYLARCTAVATGSCTEMSASGYARQPVSFALVPQTNGSTLIGNSTTYSFGGAGTVAGHAVYDQPSGGNLLFVIPLATPGQASAMPTPREPGNIRFSLAGLPANPNVGVIPLAPGAVVGATVDGSPVSSGIAMLIDRGQVTANPLQTTLANLPAAGVKGRQRVFCTDCRKPGEASGAGTGMPVFDNGTIWYSFAGTAAAN